MSAGEGAELADEGLVVAEQIGQRGLGLGGLAVTRQTPSWAPSRVCAADMAESSVIWSFERFRYFASNHFGEVSDGRVVSQFGKLR